MGEIGEDEGNPGEEEIPDQTGMTGRIRVHHPRPDQPDADRARQVEQDEDGDVMPVAVDEVFYSVESHFYFFKNSNKTWLASLGRS